MSILVNLLPDLRQAKLRDLRRKQFAVGATFLVVGISVASIVVLFLWSAGQSVAIQARTNSIEKNKIEIQQIEGLVDALTASQHLSALPALYSNRVLYTKFFAAYIEADPQKISLNQMSVDESSVLKVTGIGPTYAEVAKLARALEASNVSVGIGAEASNVPYFANVSISSASSSNGTVRGVSFTLSATVSKEVLSDSK